MNFENNKISLPMLINEYLFYSLIFPKENR